MHLTHQEKVLWIEVYAIMKRDGHRLYVKSIREENELLAHIYKERSDMLVALAKGIEENLIAIDCVGV